MNLALTLRSDLLSRDIHPAALWGLAGALFLAWGWAHWRGARWLRTRGQRRLGAAGRVVLGALSAWALWQAVGRHLLLETTWPLALHGLLAGGAAEAVLGLYQLEKRLVSPRVGRCLSGLRLLGAAAVLTILVQPVFSRQETRTVDRHVVVLLDESESMQQADRAMPVTERLGLADFLGLGGLAPRPLLGGQIGAVASLAARLEAAAESVRPADGVNEAAAKELIAAQAEPLQKILTETVEWSRAAAASLDEGQEAAKQLPEDLKRILRGVRRDAVDFLQQAWQQGREAVSGGEGRKLRAALRDAAGAASRAAAAAGPLVVHLDEQYYAALPSEVRQQISTAAARSRRDLAVEALQRQVGGQASILGQLQEKYTVRVRQFGQDSVETASLPQAAPLGSALRARSDLTGALAQVQQAYPAESLAGIVLLSDARHNGPLPPDVVARSLGSQGSPVVPVLVGSAAGARDAAIVQVSHPQSLFLGDRLRVKVDLKLDRLRGQEVKVSLRRGEQVVKEEVLKVPDEAWRTSLRLDDLPEAKGIYEWSVRIDPVEGEQFPQNNEWRFEAAVSDDRTNVLLIDDHPRWEFRYLRNLFDSRDKSVQLQYVLLHPDQVAGAEALPALAAAAGRPFGQSEATRLPASAEEWRKFDVIILGDVPPELVTEETWGIIRECVGQRGAMLVLVAGPNYLPHAFAHEAARDLIPVKYAGGPGPFGGAEAAYRLVLTAEGKQSPVFSQSLSGLENSRIWEQMPLLRWRHGHEGAKEGSRVLAWAEPVAVDGQGNALPLAAKARGTADPAGELQRRKALESKNALVVASQVDLGKVVMLSFDQTWRFRYGVGDTYHHRFWGQLLRWGAGESLPSGTPAVRLGTDLLRYLPGQPVAVRARLMDEQFRPLSSARVRATVRRDGQEVASRELTFRRDSQGLYEGQIEGLTEPGIYAVELSGPEVERLGAKDGVRSVSQKITVSNAANPVELGDLTVDPEMAAKLASLSGGVVTGLGDAAALLSRFGPGTRVVVEQKETSLWDNWIILAVALGALSAEWVLRRRHALA